jgi:hypothetical protein
MLLKIGFVVVYYVTIRLDEEKKVTGHILVLILTVKKYLKIASYYIA